MPGMLAKPGIAGPKPAGASGTGGAATPQSRLPYSWYTQNYTPTSFDESGHGIYQPMSEEEWNHTPESYQHREVNNNPQGGNGFYDQGLAQRFEAAVGQRPQGYQRGMSAVRPGTKPSDFVNPNLVWTDPQSGMQFTWDENYTPNAQNRDRGFFGEHPWFTGISTVLGAGAAYNAFGAGLGGGEALGGPGWAAEGGAPAGGAAAPGAFTTANAVGSGAPGWVAEGGAGAAGAGAGASLPSLSNILRGGSLLSRLLMNGGGQQGGGMPNGNNNNSLPQGSGLPPWLQTILNGAQGAGAYALDERNNERYQQDINRFTTLGTGGVTPEDRKPYREQLSGVLDGSRDPAGLEQISRLSARNFENQGRKFSAQGEAAGWDPHATKAWMDYNNELTGKFFGQETDRLERLGGFNIDPSRMAAAGLLASGNAYNNRANVQAGGLDWLNQLLGGGQGGQGGVGQVWNWLSSLFGNGYDGSLMPWETPDVGAGAPDPGDFGGGFGTPEGFPF